MTDEVMSARVDPGADNRPPEADHDPERSRRSLRGIRIFSSARDAPRARRPTDAVLLVLSILGIVFLSFPAPGPTAIDTATANLVAALPGLAGWFWEISYDLLLVWSLFLLSVALFAQGRKRLFLDELLAVALALGFAVIASGVGGTDPSTSLEALVHSSSPPIYLATRVALATAMVVTASPHLARPLRYLGRWLIAVGAIAAVALGAALPIGVAAGFLIGFVAAALTHLLVGSPGGRLTLAEVSEALDDLGVEVTDLVYAPLQPEGVALVKGTSPGGRPLLLKIYGRDAWDGQLVASIWSSMWQRDSARHVGFGRLQQVEHQAFVTLLVERAGVPVMPLVAAGRASEGDALLVLEGTDRTLDSTPLDEIDDDLLRNSWQILEALHDVGLAHGRLDATSIGIGSDGSAVFVDLGAASVAAGERESFADRAQLLVATAVAVGTDRAVGAATDVLGAEGISAVLPYLQPAVFDRATRKTIREQDWSLKELRSLVAERTESEIPPLEPIRRFTLRTLVKFAVGGLLAYWLISSFADVDINSLIDEFKQADMAWILAALIVTPFVQVPQAFSTMGATLQAVRFGPVLMLQYGVQFIALVVPSSAARVALEIRFFERVGVPGAGAVSIGMLDSFSTFLIQMLMIVIITVSGMASLNLTSSGDPSSSGGSLDSVNWEAIVIGVVLIGLALGIALLLPKTRALLHRFRETLREKSEDAKDALRVLRHPSKLLLLFGGNLVAQVMLAILLGLCLKAFGHSASLAALILVNTFVCLFAGFMPVPGGVGVAEAGYTAGLIAIGIPNAAATSTAIAFRLVTFYLPPIWGAFAMRWMKQHSYL